MFLFAKLFSKTIDILKTRKDKTSNFNYYLTNQHKLKIIFSFNWVYFTKNNENLLEKGSNAMVNGMKNHKKN